MKKQWVYVWLVFLSPLASSVCADEFYVAYEWKKPGGDRIKSWNTGYIDENINTQKGMLALMELLKKENNIEDTVVILFVKKLDGATDKPTQRHQFYLKGQLI